MMTHVSSWLGPAYGLVGELLLSPQDRDSGAVRAWVAELSEAAPERVREPIEGFLDQPEAHSEPEYVQTLELSPPCPPYAGAYLFDEPTSCRGAGTSGRNGYMIKLTNIYKHFRLEPAGGELPDYLPQMVDFCRLTLPCVDDPLELRPRFIAKYLRPALGPFRQRLEEYGSVYARLVEALEAVVEADLGAGQAAERTESGAEKPISSGDPGARPHREKGAWSGDHGERLASGVDESRVDPGAVK